MPVRSKPTSVPPAPEPQNEEQVQAFLQRGGSAAAPADSADEGEQVVNLKIPKSLLRTIDGLVAARLVRTYRVQWLMEAIHEKIHREQQGIRSDIR